MRTPPGFSADLMFDFICNQSSFDPKSPECKKRVILSWLISLSSSAESPVAVAYDFG